MVRISSTSAGFAAGAMFDSVDRWRELIDDDSTGPALAQAIARLGKGRALELAGAELKRVPAPYAADHPRGDLLRHKASRCRTPWARPHSLTGAPRG